MLEKDQRFHGLKCSQWKTEFYEEKIRYAAFIRQIVVKVYQNMQGSGWFGEDDLLLAQSNPLRVLDTRPYILQSDSSSHSLFHSVSYYIVAKVDKIL